MVRRTVSLLALVCVALLSAAAFGQANQGYLYHRVVVLDDVDRAVDEINEVYIYLPGTTTTQTIYADRGLTKAITLPMTKASTNTTLSGGAFHWWGADQYDFKVGNDTVSVSNAHTEAFDSTMGTIRFPYSTGTIFGTRRVETFTDEATLTVAQSGTVCVCDGNDGSAGNVVLTLPAAAAGLTYTFVDANATAGDDLYIQAGAGDTINDGTAAKYLACKTDSAGQSVTLVAVDDKRWLIIGYAGTWANDNDTPD